MRSVPFQVGLLVSAFMFASVATAQEKGKAAPAAKAEAGKAVMTVVAENDKVRVFESRTKPGEVNTSAPTTATRVLRVLSGGSQIRTYADGKTEKNEYKTGEVRILGPGPQFTTKNVGNTEIYLYVVQLK